MKGATTALKPSGGTARIAESLLSCRMRKWSANSTAVIGCSKFNTGVGCAGDQPIGKVPRSPFERTVRIPQHKSLAIQQGSH